MKFIVIVFLSLVSLASHAEVTCKGKIIKLVKWTDKQQIAVYLDNTDTRWILLPGDQESNAMALAAHAANKTAVFYWRDREITSCSAGWQHYRKFNGYFMIE